MSFGDNGGAVGYLVGEENKGLAYMFTMMNHARLNVGAQGVAMSDRAYQHAVAYANDRVQGLAPGDKEKGTIIRHPDIRRMLMVMRSMTEASRAVCYVASSAFDMAHHGTDEEQRRLSNARGELLTPIAKGNCQLLENVMPYQSPTYIKHEHNYNGPIVLSRSCSKQGVGGRGVSLDSGDRVQELGPGIGSIDRVRG